MIFNEHYNLEGCHAILSPSNHYWLRYKDKARFSQLLKSREAIKRGVEDHEFACTCIQRKQKLPKSKQTLNAYVNDAIGYHMEPEKILYYSEYCFGTADAIVFNERQKKLRIHDLKTGVTKASMDQLLLYAGLFCLEYKKKPSEITVELRIYQSNEVVVHNPEPDELMAIIDQIILANKNITELKQEEPK